MALSSHLHARLELVKMRVSVVAELLVCALLDDLALVKDE